MRITLDIPEAEYKRYKQYYEPYIAQQISGDYDSLTEANKKAYDELNKGLNYDR